MATRDEMIVAAERLRDMGDLAGAEELLIEIGKIDAKMARPVGKAKPKAPKKPKGGRGSFLDPLAQGVTLGGADEALAALMAIPAAYQTDQSIPDAYRGLRDKLRGQAAAYRQDNPILSPALEFAGALPTGILGGARLLGHAPTMARYASVGAGEGAVAGVMSADQDELTQGAIGGVLGGVMGPLGALIPTSVSGKSVPQLKMREAVDADTLTPTVMRARARQMGPDATMADIGGDALVGLSQGVAGTSPKTRALARQGLAPRIRKQSEKILNLFEETTGIRPDYGLVSGQIDEVAARRSAQAKPLWDKVVAHDIPMTPVLEKALKQRVVKRAWNKAKEEAALGGRELPEVFAENADGDLVPTGVVPDMQAWSMIKTHLDDVVKGGDYVDEKTLRPTKLGMSAQKFRDELVDELNTLTDGDYAIARSAWAGESAIIDALDEGRKVLRKPVSEVIKDARRLSVSEKEAYLTGLMESIKEKMGAALPGQASETRFLETENFAKKLRAFLPEGKQGKAGVEKILRELRTQRTFRDRAALITRGAQTQPRQAMERALQDTPQQIGDIITGDPTTRAVGAVANWIGSKVKAVPTEMKEELAAIMFKPGGVEEAIAYLKRSGLTQKRIDLISRRLKSIPAALTAAGLTTYQAD